MPPDITKPNSHIYWQYVLMFAIVSAGITAYLDLRGKNDCLSARVADNEMSLRVQLAQIETRLAGIEKGLSELKLDLREKNRLDAIERKEVREGMR